ncbi:hypothetical protein [Sulfitobacter sp. S190]|uniref:FliH/SctL family protein n=1 Tax=Sulfitobacter sp. S190 TaxID=2867022 RepID=UPI0021A8BC9E|nr:hypothetical protein [Sulfitobacter sp. S190]UWR22356.1 hypothetical protein K3756_17105 [Sulfitobacter sp. S190]
MTSIALRYRDFGELIEASAEAVPITTSKLEQARLDSFEEGYQAGWSDATVAAESGQNHIQSDFAQNLADLNFTYHEAVAKLQRGLVPLFNEIADQIIPRSADAALSGHLRARLDDLAQQQIEGKFVLTTHPLNLDMMNALAETVDTALPITVTADDTLGEGQVFVQLGTIETEINTDEITQSIADGLKAYAFHSQKEASND